MGGAGASSLQKLERCIKELDIPAMAKLHGKLWDERIALSKQYNEAISRLINNSFCKIDHQHSRNVLTKLQKVSEECRLVHFFLYEAGLTF